VKALLVLAVFAIPLAAQVEGRVVNAVTGTAIPGARVTLFQNGEPVHRSEADARGAFQFESVQTGVYEARYTAPHFSPVPAVGELMPQVQVRAGEPLRLDIKLEPLAKISGRVTDSDGKPVSKADIWAVRDWAACKPPACSPFRMHATANDHGEYTLSDIEIDGKWEVVASSPGSIAQTFYGETTEPQLAASVPVSTGAEVWNIDIQLLATPTRRVRGRVLDVHGKPAIKVAVAIDPLYGSTLQRETDADGAFAFPSVPAGDWRISASSGKDDGKTRTADNLHVGDHDVENLDLRLAAPFKLPGRIVTEVPEGMPAPPLPRVETMLLSNASSFNDSPREVFLVGEPLESREFSFQPVYPGRYMVMPVGDSTKPYYLDSIRLGDRDASGVDVPIQDGGAPLVVTFKLGGGSVQGKVNGCRNASVVLVPLDPALRRGGFFGVGHCAADGAFHLSAIRPGEYYGLAMVGDHGPVFDEGILKQAVRVTVRANETTSADPRVLR